MGRSCYVDSPKVDIGVFEMRSGVLKGSGVLKVSTDGRKTRVTMSEGCVTMSWKTSLIKILCAARTASANNLHAFVTALVFFTTTSYAETLVVQGSTTFSRHLLERHQADLEAKTGVQ